MSPRLDQAVEGAVGATGLNININSTTGGAHSGLAHSQGRAGDINRINGLRVDNPANVGNVLGLQLRFGMDPNVNQVLGPVLNVNLWPGAPPVSPDLATQHEDHIHVNVYP